MDAPDLTKLESSLDTLLGETSWRLSHAQTLSDYGRIEEADAELAGAAVVGDCGGSLLATAGRDTVAVRALNFE